MGTNDGLERETLTELGPKGNTTVTDNDKEWNNEQKANGFWVGWEDEEEECLFQARRWARDQ